MNEFRRRARRVTAMLLSIFVILACYFAYSLYQYGGRWAMSPYNPRLKAQKQTVRAGDILDTNGVVLASTGADGGRTYPIGKKERQNLSHILGDPAGTVNGVETFMAGYLLGFNSGLFERVYQMVSGEGRRGADVTLTIDSKLQSYIAGAFPDGKKGAVVVMNYKTGALYALYSNPTFDPSNVKTYLEASGSPLVNRATQGRYTPGSIFKVVTLAAAIDYAPALLNETFACAGEETIGSFAMRNNEGAYHGEETLREAFLHSCNLTFGHVGTTLGVDTLRRGALALGFNDNFLFADIVTYDSIYKDASDEGLLAWTAVGQGETQVTPLHMAMVAAAVANGGDMMEPRLLKEATDTRGGIMATGRPRLYKRALPSATAETMADYMTGVVKSGSGTRAAVKGYTVAGKTGTAQLASSGSSVKPHAWFIGFVRDDKHPYAICVLVENGESGGRVAAPLASKVLKKAIDLGED